MLKFLYRSIVLIHFFFNHTATTNIYTLSLHDALPILHGGHFGWQDHIFPLRNIKPWLWIPLPLIGSVRSEEHTSELQSRENLVCRLLLEKKNSTARRNKQIMFTPVMTK